MTEHQITVTDETGKFQDDEALRNVIRTALEEEKTEVPCEIDVLITDNAGIREINMEQRGIDRDTDVLSFPMFELQPGIPAGPDNTETDPETGLVMLGDMVISLEKCEEQARDFGHSLQREISYLAVHSVLHLLGYDHVDEGPEKKRMREREEAILSSLGITREMAQE